ncbi:MAG: hypothetical protein L3J66_05040 [Bacteroidales bacterium]|nr:hypothetical protein [Bacteroidales bacterium]
MKRILISQKADWIRKCRDKTDKDKYEITYGTLSDEKNFGNYDAVIPLFEHDSTYLNNHAQTLKGIKFNIPSNDVIQLCYDKKRFHNFLTKEDFGNFVPEISDELKPPYILKKIFDEWGRNSYLINSVTEEEAHRERLVSGSFFKQLYVSGREELTTHFIFSKGKFQYMHSLLFKFKPCRYVKGRQLPPFKNASISVVKNSFVDIFTQILSRLNYEGVGCIDYKVKDGKPLIFEINPRVGGSLPLDVNRFLGCYLKSLKYSFLRKMRYTVRLYKE